SPLSLKLPYLSLHPCRLAPGTLSYLGIRNWGKIGCLIRKPVLLCRTLPAWYTTPEQTVRAAKYPLLHSHPHLVLLYTSRRVCHRCLRIIPTQPGTFYRCS